MAAYCAGDVALTEALREECLPEVFDLTWIDPSLHEAEAPVAKYEKTRRFAHCGAAIAWARRQIFHGKVFGEHIEMKTVSRYAIGSKVRESEAAVVDITLPGFRRWSDASDYNRGARGIALGRPERKCRTAD